MTVDILEKLVDEKKLSQNSDGDISYNPVSQIEEGTYIGVLAAMNDLRCAFCDIALEDIFQVGRGELTDFVIVLDVQSEVFPVGGYVHHTRVGIFWIVGQVVLGDEHDVVIVVAGVFEHTVDVEGIRLVAVVIPTRRGGHHHGIAVLEGLVLKILVTEAW